MQNTPDTQKDHSDNEVMGSSIAGVVLESATRPFVFLVREKMTEQLDATIAFCALQGARVAVFGRGHHCAPCEQTDLVRYFDVSYTTKAYAASRAAEFLNTDHQLIYETISAL